MDSLWLLGGGSVSAAENNKQATVGFEYAPTRMMALRASVGYRMALTGPTNDALIMAGGIGIAYSMFNVDFAVLPMAAAGYQERVSLSIHFGTPESDRVDVDNAEDKSETMESGHSGMLGSAWQMLN